VIGDDQLATNDGIKRRPSHRIYPSILILMTNCSFVSFHLRFCLSVSWCNFISEKFLHLIQYSLHIHAFLHSGHNALNFAHNEQNGAFGCMAVRANLSVNWSTSLILLAWKVVSGLFVVVNSWSGARRQWYFDQSTGTWRFLSNTRICTNMPFTWSARLIAEYYTQCCHNRDSC